MEFFDRKYELAETEELTKKGSRMLVLYGKRRIGKTALIAELFKHTESKNLYFFVPKNERISSVLENFASMTKDALGLKEYEKITDFSDLIKLLFDYSKKDKIIVAFDEFQNFNHIYPQATDILQKEWDALKEQSNLSLLISGSVVGMIKDMFMGKGSPLFGRAYNVMELREFGIEETFELMDRIGVKDIEDKLRLYFMFGGVISYYVLMDYYGLKSFEEVVDRLLLSPVTPLKDIVKNDMIEAFGNSAPAYFSILESIASGKNRNNDIAAYVQLKETSVPQYISDLKSLLGIVDSITLPTKKIKPGSKKNALEITDNFYNFWFEVIWKDYKYYEMQDIEGLRKRIYGQISVFNGRAFERYAQGLIKVLSKREVMFGIDRIGNWWGRDPSKPNGLNEEEIDIVAINDKTKDILFAECKWTNSKVGPDTYEELKRKGGLVQWHNDSRKEHYALFSKAGFTEEMEKAAKKEKVMLFDLDAIAEALENKSYSNPKK